MAARPKRVFRQATSLGSVESLVEHRASVEGPGTLCPPDLVRLSIGVAICDMMSVMRLTQVTISSIVSPAPSTSFVPPSVAPRAVRSFFS